MTEHPPRRGRRSTGPDRAATLTAALRIIDAEGVAGLSMRRLGRELDCDPMSLYRHAATKDKLVDAVVEALLMELKVDPADDDWAAQLRGLARQFRALALAHPNVVPLLVTRPLATPIALLPLGALRPLESVLEMLIRAGFAPAKALRVYRLVYGSMQGHVLTELQTVVANEEEADDLLRLGLQRLPLSEFPRIRALAPVLAAYDGSEELERRMDIMISGLHAEMHPTASDDVPSGA